MAYTTTNFETKKALKKAVASGDRIGLVVWSPGPWPVTQNGTDVIEGPQYPKPHRWYASVIIKDGIVVKVAK